MPRATNAVKKSKTAAFRCLCAGMGGECDGQVSANAAQHSRTKRRMSVAIVAHGLIDGRRERLHHLGVDRAVLFVLKVELVRLLCAAGVIQMRAVGVGNLVQLLDRGVVSSAATRNKTNKSTPDHAPGCR